MIYSEIMYGKVELSLLVVGVLLLYLLYLTLDTFTNWFKEDPPFQSAKKKPLPGIRIVNADGSFEDISGEEYVKNK